MKPHLRGDLAQPDLLELLQLDDAGFKARFAGTPMLRTKRRGLLRNVCVALGNAGIVEYAGQPVEQFLASAEKLARLGFRDVLFNDVGRRSSG